MCDELYVMGSTCQQNRKNCVDACLSLVIWAVKIHHKKLRHVQCALLSRLAGEQLQWDFGFA
jgi:hypothetical protein